MKLGVDLSILDELEKLNPKFRYEGKEVEPFSFFSKHSRISMVRLRLWHNPYDKDGNAYGGGTNDIEALIRLARRAKENGMQVLLDFHYSDFWVDPSRQKLPKAWEGLSFKEVVKALEDYTRETLLRLKEEDIDVGAIQIGNEITNGMVFPFGQLEKEYNEENGGGFDGFAALFKAGVKASREIYPQAKILCHLEHAGSKDMQEWYLSEMIKRDVDFDVVGESYYPYWHGPLKDFKENVTNIINKFHKEVWVVEMGYEHSESLVEGHHTYFEMVGEEFEVGNINGRIPFEGTKEGQANYLRTFLKICNDLGVDMVFYWEPAWVLMPDNGWAKDPGQIYCGLEPTTAYNDWANETLFDFSGDATPAIDIFTQDFIDSLK